MKPIREYMRDGRVAAALAVVAALTVGYRVMSSREAPPAPAEQVSGELSPPEASPPPGPPSARESGAPPPLPPAVPPGWSGPSWTWDRNPFLSASSAGRASGAGEAAGDPSFPVLRGTVGHGRGGAAIFRGDRPDGGDVLVPVGGTIGGWTLSGVEPYRVHLRRGREARILELYRQ